MAELTTIYCASPDCKNECGKKMELEEFISSSNKLKDKPDTIRYGYFCEEPERIYYTTAQEWADNWVEKNKDLLKRLADK